MLQSHPPHAVAPARVRPGIAADRAPPRSPAQLDEARALHRLFLGLSDRYETHCRTTGARESAHLCAAAARYRQERSLVSLVSFMDCLDELDIPAPPGGRKRWS